MTSAPLSPAEYGQQLAADAPALTDTQVEAAARLLAGNPPDGAGGRAAA